MLFTNVFLDAMADAIRAESNFLGGGADLAIGLVQSDFTPDAALELTDIVLVEGNGLDPKTLGAGSAIKVWQTTDGVWSFLINEPAGGLNFVCTGTTDPPQQAFGYALLNADDSTLIASAKFNDPITFTHIGQAVVLDAIVGTLAAPFID